MNNVLTPRHERKSSAHGFESVGSILARLFKQKAKLEASMTLRFNYQRSLELDQVLLRIEELQAEGSPAW